MDISYKISLTYHSITIFHVLNPLKIWSAQVDSVFDPAAQRCDHNGGVRCQKRASMGGDLFHASFQRENDGKWMNIMTVHDYNFRFLSWRYIRLWIPNSEMLKAANTQKCHGNSLAVGCIVVVTQGIVAIHWILIIGGFECFWSWLKIEVLSTIYIHILVQSQVKQLKKHHERNSAMKSKWSTKAIAGREAGQ